MFAKRLKLLRKEKRLTQENLAKELNVSKSTIAMWETGRRDPDTGTIMFIANYFDVTTDYLIGNTNDPTPMSKWYKYKQPTIEEAVKTSFDLSEESKKELEGYIKLLKIRDSAKNMNNEIGMEIKPRFVN